MKKIILVIISVLALTSCGNSESQTASNSAINSVAYISPSDCLETKILSAFPASIANPVWIDTTWQPAPGTDLEAVYKAGGIACTYGIQRAEIGGTFMWAPNTDGLYQSRIEAWKKAGYTKSDIPELSESDAYIISDAARTAMEIPSWSANVLIDNFWISIGGAFIQNTSDAIPLIKAAVESLRLVG